MNFAKVSLCSVLLGALLALPAGAQMQPDNLPSRQQSSGGDLKRSAKLHTELGSRYFLSGQNAFALDELRIALNSDSNYYLAYSVRALVYATLKEYAKAEDDFQRALSLAPQDPEVNNNYGWYLCETGKARQSIQYYLNALKNPLYETPERAYANAGRCALKAGDLAGAQGYLQQAIRLAPEQDNESRFQLALLHFQRGQLDEARQHLGDALKLMEPPTAQALWLGIRLERKLGNRLAEGSYAAQLRSRYPGSTEYQDFLNGKFND